MPRTASMIVVLSLLVAASATASEWISPGDVPYRDWARVVSRTPIYETVRVVTPRRECWTERVAYERLHRDGGHGSYAPTLVGATIGGVIGHELGHKRRGRRIAAVVGALVGGSLGHEMHRHHRRRRGRTIAYRDEERCEIREEVEYEEHVVGYDVEYRFHGRTYWVRLDHDPGSRLEVAYDVRPWE
jgi:uncharacterized protein YcfJ